MRVARMTTADLEAEAVAELKSLEGRGGHLLMASQRAAFLAGFFERMARLEGWEGDVGQKMREAGSDLADLVAAASRVQGLTS